MSVCACLKVEALLTDLSSGEHSGPFSSPALERDWSTSMVPENMVYIDVVHLHLFSLVACAISHTENEIAYAIAKACNSFVKSHIALGAGSYEC